MRSSPSRTSPQLRSWPFLKKYSGRFLDKVALPVGGIGTGTVGFKGNGALTDWEIMNVPAKGYVPFFSGQLKNPAPSFLLRYEEEGKPAALKLLEGPMPLAQYEGAEGSAAPNANLPRFRKATFRTAYPFGEVRLKDKVCPLRVKLQAFNPFLPGDVAASSWPVAAFRCILKNPTTRPIRAAVALSLPNFIGADGSEFSFSGHSRVQDTVGSSRNVNEYRATGEIAGVFLASHGVERDHPAWGTMSITTKATPGLSHRSGWADVGWGDALLDFWEDLLSDGKLEERPSKADTPMASLCVEQEIAPGETAEIPFLLAWHFPNRVGWRFENELGDLPIGNFYTSQFDDAWQVAEKYWPESARLEEATKTFVEALLADDAPEAIKEAALFNLSTLRSQTCFRAKDGRFYAWEGVFDRKGSCFGSCSHVWNYEQAMGPLFPELAKSMHRTAFLERMDERGKMPFRIRLSTNGEEYAMSAADGQTGHILRVYREWTGTGDAAFLAEMWPAVKKALEFCWLPGGWDADQDGVMEGCQHNTMDVEYYGPNPQMETWYLAALKAGAAMARQMGEEVFAKKCEELFQQGSAWTDENLFNGSYYEHHIRPPQPDTPVLEGLRWGAPDLTQEIPYQLGAGCLIDQLVGEWAARLCGLGRLLEREHVVKTLQSILQYNQRRGMWEHFNHLRTYTAGDEAAVLMASFPLGRRPARPFPYFNEVMTGFEYVLAGHLLLEGMEEEGLECVRDIRARYDGARRNPYNEAECGSHYGRALASWALLAAWSGCAYDVSEERLSVEKSGRHFWLGPAGFGTIEIAPRRSRTPWKVEVRYGSLRLAEIRFGGKTIYQKPVVALVPGDNLTGGILRNEIARIPAS